MIDTVFNGFSLTAIVGGTLFLFLGLGVLFKGRIVVRFFAFILALALLTTGAVFVLGGVNLASYNKFTAETQIATLDFKQLGKKGYQVTLINNHKVQTFFLKGDQWQMDVRLIKWTHKLALLGADPLYRLERLSGRYKLTYDEMNSERTVYGFSSNFSGIDLWLLINKIPQLRPFIDTQYGSATYLPMVNGGKFIVLLTATGLVARPVNDIARQAVRHW